MIRFNSLHMAGALVCGLTLSTAPPTSVVAQELAHAPRLEQSAWPRWEGLFGTPVSRPPTSTPQNVAQGSDARVLGFSTIGAAAGWMGGALLGAGLCYNGCGDDDWDGLGVVLALGVAGGGVGSTLSGCSVAGGPGCIWRVMPKALLGSLAAAAASVAVVSTTESGLAGLVTFSMVQGLLTTRFIR